MLLLAFRNRAASVHLSPLLDMPLVQTWTRTVLKLLFFLQLGVCRRILYVGNEFRLRVDLEFEGRKLWGVDAINVKTVW